MYWNKRVETISRDELRYIQNENLSKMLRRIYHNVPFYRSKFQEMNLYPEDIKDIDDLSKLPFTTKQDMRDNYPYGLFATDLSEIVRLHASSGTTGKPTVVGYTREDINNWAEVCARSIVAAGGSPSSVIQIAYGYGLFTGGLGLHYGAERLGASTIPISSGNTDRQVMLMKDFHTTFLACTPSYALYLADSLEEHGISPEELDLKAGIFGAEPWSENMRKEIEKRLNISAHNIYGLSEIIGPGVASECSCQNGMHVWEDHFIPEIIDPNTLEPLPYGSLGELVFTSITKEGLPLLRYRTRDLTVLNNGTCECGRTHVKMNRVMGRSDDMIIVRGVNVFPSQIEDVLLGIGEVEPHYQLIITREGTLDCLEVQVEVTDNLFSDRIKNLESLKNTIKSKLASVLQINAKVTLVESRSIPRSEGKANRVIDKRNY
ncbi:MAG TPA: phenylacetate--CoA ligase [Tissierellaceae bacterium]|nr:phenylacetate--CoA ligase [Tissierellaceae bacterium]